MEGGLKVLARDLKYLLKHRLKGRGQMTKIKNGDPKPQWRCVWENEAGGIGVFFVTAGTEAEAIALSTARVGVGIKFTVVVCGP